MTATSRQFPGAAGGFFGPGDPPPCELLEMRPERPALLVCDHASARIPAALGNLGLSAEDLAGHIALDIGAADLTRALAERLQLPAVLAGYSRLVVDCNRRLDDPTAFPAASDGIVVPGNAGLGDTERAARAESLYWPYHHAVRDQLAALEALAPAPALVAIHSFTPVMNGAGRPWQVGILWDKDPRLPMPVMERLRSHADLSVGDNQPYSGRHPADFTVDHHAEAEGLAHISIEVRQDLIASEVGVSRWARLLADALQPSLDEPSLYTHWAG